jgi:DUF1009 family protein
MGEKTTIEIDNLRELKQHALDTNKTLKQLINEAINEKIIREREQIQKGNYKSLDDQINYRKEEINPADLTELKKYLTNAGLLKIVEKACGRHNLNFKDLSPVTITQQLIDDIHKAITSVFDDDIADETIQKIEALKNN